MPTPSEKMQAIIDAFTLKAKADEAVAAVEPILVEAVANLPFGSSIPIDGTPFVVVKPDNNGIQIHKVKAPPTLGDLIK